MTQNQDKHLKKDKKQLRVRKKERTKQEILKAAEKFFSEKPMSEVSLEDIAEAAFVSRTTVYNYFKNKDEIFFSIGTQAYKEANELIEKDFPSDLSGIEQVLNLCERGFRENLEEPLHDKIVRESFNRINYRNIPMEEIHNKINENIGTTKFKELIESFEEPYLIEFYIQAQKHRDVWIRAVRNGKMDNTIKINLEDVQIVEFLYMLLMGIADMVELRKSILNRIRLDNETVIINLMNLITKFLKNESKIKK
jgi:AcrR family transcriptional regulator